MTPPLVFADARLLERARTDALRTPGRERCGLLLGASAPKADREAGIAEGGREEEGPPGVVTEIVPVSNVAQDPRSSYEVDPRALLDAHRREREGGPQVLGVYHCHPDGEARPSSRDRELAWPGYSYLIFTPDGEARSWRLVEGAFEEEEIRTGRMQRRGRIERPEEPSGIRATSEVDGDSAILAPSRAMRFLTLLYLFVAGIFLLLAPWTSFWDRNFFVRLLVFPGGGGFLDLWLRALVCSFGVAHLALLGGDLFTLWVRRRSSKGGG